MSWRRGRGAGEAGDSRGGGAHGLTPGAAVACSIMAGVASPRSFASCNAAAVRFATPASRSWRIPSPFRGEPSTASFRSLYRDRNSVPLRPRCDGASPAVESSDVLDGPTLARAPAGEPRCGRIVFVGSA